MDKVAANNYITALRKEVKKAKAMVAGNLIRKIDKLKREREKIHDDEEESKKKIDAKIDRIYTETKLLKTLDFYPVCKDATFKPDVKLWEDVISNPKSTPEERLKARVTCKNSVQKVIAKFRSDHKECDEWLEEYFEFREKKREIVESTSGKKKKRQFENTAEVRSRSNHKSSTNGKKEGIWKRDKGEGSRSASKSYSDNQDRPSAISAPGQLSQLHPSWEARRKQKELVKAALSGNVQQQQQTKPLSLNDS